MAKADIQAGKAYVSLYAKGGELTKALNKAKRELTAFGAQIAKIGAGISAMGGAITGSLTGAVVHFAATGDALDKMARRTGVSATALAELGFAAEQSGSSIDDVESAIQRMQKNLGGIGEESAKVTSALNALGLSADEIRQMAPEGQFEEIADRIADIEDPARRAADAIQGIGDVKDPTRSVADSIRRMSPEDQFQAIAERIADIEDPSKRAAAAMAVFGSGGRQLLPMLENIRELREEARELGIAPSPESVAAAAEITDAINRVRRVVSATIFEIGSSIAPMVSDLLAGFLQAASAVRKFIVENRNLVVLAAKVGAALTLAGGAIVGIGTGFAAAGLAISGVLSVMSAFAAAGGIITSVLGAIVAGFGLLLSPVGLLVAALVGGVVAWAKFSQAGRDQVAGLVGFGSRLLQGFRQTFGDTFAGITEAIRGGDLRLAGQIAMTGLRLVFQQGLEAIHGLFGETIGTLVGQILGGDLSGAWSTLGSTMLASWAKVANGIVSIFASMSSTLVSKWRKTVDAIANDILAQAGEGGIFGKAFEAISGVNVKEEMERAKRLEQQRRDRGLTPQDDDIASQIAAGTYQDPGIAAIEQRMQGIIQSVSDLSQEMSDAANLAVDNAVDGQTAAASARVKQLQEELADLRREAQEKIEAGNAEREERARVGGFDEEEPVARVEGRASAASTNLMDLQQQAGKDQGRQQIEQLAKVEKAVENAAEKQAGKIDEVVIGLRNLGLFHA